MNKIYNIKFRKLFILAQNNSVISFQGIVKEFRGKRILDNLNLEIFQGQILVILGKSGCGKSTLFKIFLGFYKPDFGKIIYNGKDLIKNPLEIRKIIGFVSQENSFYENLTVQENLNFFGKLYDLKYTQIVERSNFLLNLVKLTNSANLIGTKLSGGMKRRLEFAISLIHDPKILLLDEPFTGLDIEIRNELWNILKQIRNSGVTIIMASHLITTVQKNADRVVFLNNLRIDADLELNPYLRDLNNFDLELKFLEVIHK